MDALVSILKKRRSTWCLSAGCLGVLLLADAHRPTAAATVDWTGAVANTCVVTVNSHGALGVSVNGQTMSSEQPTGMAASVGVMSTGPNLVTFGAPAMTLWAPTYTGTPVMATKQRSNKGHSSNWQVAAHQATVDAGDTVFDLHAQVDDVGKAFPMGAYKVSSDVTCSPAN